MENIIRFTESALLKHTAGRSGEIKYGERIQVLPLDTSIEHGLKHSDAEFVLLSIPEDIGVRANYGRAGAATAWDSAVKSIINLQHNKFFKAGKLLILGCIDTADAMQQSQGLDPNEKTDRKKLFTIVDQLDKEVSHIVALIVKSGKTPIIIGGGHNNAYGNIKGTALAKGKPVSAVNFDAHTDFRMLEGRHSGNGFSYAYEEGFLKNYFIFGLHENYAGKGVMETIKKTDGRVRFNSYEQIAIYREKSFSAELQQALQFISEDPYGIEMDLDAIVNVPSSAMTPSGFSAERARQFVHFFGKHHNAAYLHICEGAPGLDNSENSHLTGKLIAYMVTDFMKARTMAEAPGDAGQHTHTSSKI